MRRKLGANAVAIQLPIGAENDFKGIIDLVDEVAYMYKDDLGKDIEKIDIPAEFKDQVAELRLELIEKVAELDEELTMKYLEGEEITVDEIKAALRKGVCEVKIFPVICGSSYRNKGVQLMLDAVVRLPAITYLMFLTLKVYLTMVLKWFVSLLMINRFSALAFKIMTDPFVGKSYVLPCLLRYLELRFLCV